MSRSARSVLVFGVYVILLGGALVFVPNPVLDLFGQPRTGEVWIRCAGMLLLLLGVYYVLAARAGLAQFFLWTVFGRACVLFFFAGFVILGLAPAIFLAFGVVDLAGALWTWQCLRRERVLGAKP